MAISYQPSEKILIHGDMVAFNFKGDIEATIVQETANGYIISLPTELNLIISSFEVTRQQLDRLIVETEAST